MKSPTTQIDMQPRKETPPPAHPAKASPTHEIHHHHLSKVILTPFLPSGLVIVSVAIVMVIVGTLSATDRATTVPSQTPTTTPSRFAGDFLAVLDGPRSYQSRHQWKIILEGAVNRDQTRFSIEGRNQHFRQLHGAAEDSGPTAPKLVIVELLWGGGGRPTVYDRIEFMSVNDRESAVARRLQGLGVGPVDDADFKKFAESLATLVDRGGGDNGLDPAPSLTDVLIVSWYDGHRWRSGTWYWLGQVVSFLRPPPRDAAGLPPSLSAALMLIRNINDLQLRNESFGPGVYLDYVNEYLGRSVRP